MSKFITPTTFIFFAFSAASHAATLLETEIAAAVLIENESSRIELEEQREIDVWSTQSVEPFRSTVGGELDVDGLEGSNTTASASVDYEAGALKTFAEVSDGISRAQIGSASAELRDTLTFTVDDSITGPVDVQVLWQIDRIIDDFGFEEAFGSAARPPLDVTGLFSLIPVSGGDSVGFTETYTDTGTSLLSDNLTLGLSGLSSSYDYSLRMLLRSIASVADNSAVRLPGEELVFFDSLADASNSAFLNFILPEGVTVTGGQTGFLTSAPNLTATPIPLPASILLLAGALSGLAVFRRKQPVVT